MCFETSVKPDIGQTDAEPGHKTRNGGHVGEPGEDLACASGYSHECEQGEKRIEDNGDIRQPRRGSFEEYLWRIAG